MIDTENKGGVRICTLNRPEALNAFNNEQFDLVAEAFLDAEKDPSVRVLVLTGAGRAFSAGADLSDGGRNAQVKYCLLYTSPSPRDLSTSRMPSSA